MSNGDSSTVVASSVFGSTTPPESAGAEPRSLRWMKSAAASVFFLSILSVRLYFIQRYAIDLPYSDQWDSEAWTWLRPFQQGAINWDILFAPHNEHRVVLVRIMSLLLFAANDRQWDNLVSCTFNAFFVAAMSALAFRAMLRHPERGTWTVAVLLLVACILPSGYENLLLGFQAQFFFMIALTTLGVWLAATCPIDIRHGVLLALIAFVSLFSMATGLFTPVAIAVAVILRKRAAGGSWRASLPLLAILIAAAISGYLLLVPVANHMVLHAASLSEWLSAVCTAGSWPLPSSWLCFAILWLPSLLGVIAAFRGRDAGPLTISATALALWTALQIGSIAYGRGHDLHSPASRYTDILAMSVVVNAYFVTFIFSGHATGARSRWLALGALLWLGIVMAGYVGQGLDGFKSMKEFSESRRVQAENVRHYLHSGDAAALDRVMPWNLPYPDSRRLRMMLDDQTIRDMLPVSMRERLPVAGMFRDSFDRPTGAPAAVVGAKRAGGADEGAVHVDDLHSRFPYLLVPVSRHGGHELVVDARSSDGTSSHQVLPANPHASVSDVLVRVPGPYFSLIAREIPLDRSRPAIRPPVEMGRLSRATMWLLDTAPRFLAVSAIAACLLVGLYILRRVRNASRNTATAL